MTKDDSEIIVKLSNYNTVRLNYISPFIEIIKNEPGQQHFEQTTLDTNHIVSVKVGIQESKQYYISIETTHQVHLLNAVNGDFREDDWEEVYDKIMLFWKMN